MEKIKSAFSISDLENLSGINAHTIRIWEKRYHLLAPGRSDSNIRKYTNEDLCKLLNVVLLQKNGYKISKIANLSDQEIEKKINELSAGGTDYFHACINQLKNAMFQFDQDLFEESCRKIIHKNSFETLFIQVLFPLLRELGIMWHSKAISPVHEHFVTHLIKQKLYAEIDMVSSNIKISSTHQTFVIFLPHNEFHELGSLFLNYLLVREGKRCINLGPSIESKDLVTLRESIPEKIVYLSWWTILPEASLVPEYLDFFHKSILRAHDQLLITGNMIDSNIISPSPHIHLFRNPQNLVDYINTSSD